MFLTAKHLEGCSDKTIRYYRCNIEKMLDTINIPVIKITTEMLRKYLVEYQTINNCGKVTIDNIRRSLSTFFSWLEEEDYIIKSPMKRIHKVKTAVIVKDTIPDEKIEILRDNCNNLRDRAMIDFLLSTGIRVGELVRLNIDNIDFSERECVVYGKGDKERKAYFDAKTKIHLLNYIESRTDNNIALFVSLNKPHSRLTESGVELRLREMGKKLGVEKVHPHTGDTVKVVAKDGRFLAWASYSPASTLRARCWSFREDEVIDDIWFEKKIREAVAARDGLLERTNARRILFGEADGLPGLIVDQYGDWLVTQFQAAGVEAHRELIGRLLLEVTGARGVYDRSDAATRRREGLEVRSEVLVGETAPDVIEIVEDGVKYGVDVRVGHKTGFYIDQRESRLSAQRAAEEFRRRHGRGLRALNCFCYTGGFSLALLKGGAEEVVSVDSSEEALAMARANAERNGFTNRAEWLCEDVFTCLRRLRGAGEKFDLVILDPPKFASSHYHVDRAARAYKDINLNGLKLLGPGGELFTFSCSGAIDVDLFQKIVAGAVIDSGVTAWATGRFGAGEDHPLLMTCPEGEYLKGLRLAVRP